jgi:hypothetical protein
MKKAYNFYCDPGHGWMKVPFKDLERVNCDLLQISQYSYRRGKDAYLEEDCDAAVFFKAFENTFGRKPQLKVFHSNKRSKIRSYERF